MSIENMRFETVNVKELIEFPDNPRIGDVEEIKKSLVANGQYKPLIVNQQTGHVLTGNHTLKALKELNIEEAYVNYIDIAPSNEKKIVLVDNKLTDNSTYDSQALGDILQELMDDGELIGTGFVADEVDDLISTLGEAPIITEFEKFEGGYALDDKEIEKLKDNYISNADAKTESRGGERLKDVMLHYPESKYESFVEMLGSLSNKLDQKKTDTVYLAVEFLYKTHFDGNEDPKNPLKRFFNGSS